MPNNIKTTILPNGNKVYCFDANEAYILFNQVTEYLKHGITLNKNDVVIDVGANIGLFTVMLHDCFAEDINIYACEPIPETFKILSLNINSLNSKNIIALPYGLSDVDKVVELGYSPNSSMLSSVYPYDSKEEREMIKMAYINTLKNTPFDAPLFFKLLKTLPSSITSYILSRMEKKAFNFQKILCQLKTVSSLICEYSIDGIDLLKIDVEKSELDVIQGIQDSDWRKIKQAVIEVHDISNRVSQMVCILQEHGFSQVTVHQEPDLEGTNIYCIYALK